MKSLYITSVERYSGKTATCLALGMHFKANGYRVGYLKPVSLQPWRVTDPVTGAVHIGDEDASFVKKTLGLSAPSWELSPVVVTHDFLVEQLQNPTPEMLMEKIQRAFQQAIQEQDILLLEGGGCLREGYAVDLPTLVVAQAFQSQVLAVVKYRDEVRLMDDVLAAYSRLGESLCGIILNRVPADAMPFVSEVARPYIEKHKMPVFGVLPEQRGLSAISVGELVQILEAEVLTKVLCPQTLVENLTVGAMTAEAALSRFRKYPNKVVITGGDRTDIQLAALETSTACLVLTGNLRPSPLVIKQANEFGVAVLLVRTNTMETIEAIERVFGKTRLGEHAKLTRFQELLDKHLDYGRLYEKLGL